MIRLEITGSEGLRTCSTVPFMMYRITVTCFSWPSLSARPMAWASTVGFHCGSTMWIRFAHARFSLRDKGLRQLSAWRGWLPAKVKDAL